MPNFSLLCPSRRPHQVKKLLASLNATIGNFDTVEILFGIDNDDIQTPQSVQDCIETYPNLNIKIHRRNKSIHINKDYYNWLSTFAKGKFHWAIGDDLIFKINNWDGRINENLEGYLNFRKDRVVCAAIKDNTPKPSPKLPPFPCFPLVSKEAIKAIGFLLHPNIPTWGADYAVYKLYMAIERLHVIRDETYINHISYHTGQAPEDKITKAVGRTFNSLKMRPEHNVDRIVAEEVPEQAKKLREYIQRNQ